MSTRSTLRPGALLARPGLALILSLLCACRSAGSDDASGAPPAASRKQIEKPWTKETIEGHEYLWLELSTGKRGVLTGPVVSSDEHGEFLTTKTEPSVHLLLSDIVVMDGVDVTESGPPMPPVQSLAGSVLAFFGSLVYFIPLIIVLLLLA